MMMDEKSDKLNLVGGGKFLPQNGKQWAKFCNPHKFIRPWGSKVYCIVKTFLNQK